MCLGPHASAKTDRSAEQRGRGKTFFSCRQSWLMRAQHKRLCPAHKGVPEPRFLHRPSVSGSLPLLCPLKTSSVFFKLCAGLCVQACVAFPLTRIQSQHNTHTYTPLPYTLRPQLAPQLLLLLLLSCFVVDCTD